MDVHIRVCLSTNVQIRFEPRLLIDAPEMSEGTSTDGFASTDRRVSLGGIAPKARRVCWIACCKPIGVTTSPKT